MHDYHILRNRQCKVQALFERALMLETGSLSRKHFSNKFSSVCRFEIYWLTITFVFIKSKLMLSRIIYIKFTYITLDPRVEIRDLITITVTLEYMQ